MTKVNIVNQHTANRMASRVIFSKHLRGFITSILCMTNLRSFTYLEVIPAGVQIYTFCLQILCVFHSILERWDGA